MTPDLLTLARAYASLPGAPKMDPDHDGWTLARGLFRAAPTGILWRRDGVTVGTGATLAEAVARVAVAVGRAGP